MDYNIHHRHTIGNQDEATIMAHDFCSYSFFPFHLISVKYIYVHNLHEPLNTNTLKWMVKWWQQRE